VTISEWCIAAQLVSQQHGFVTTLENLPARLMLVVTECAEVVEAWRKRDDQHIGEELADIVIRTVEIAASLGIDLERAMDEKHERNKNRPYLHGGKRG